jgi:hypothetical protein
MLTLEQIRREGLEALRERLGRAGMIRFLAQFDNGGGDYAKDRHEWVDGTSLAEIREKSRHGGARDKS